MHAVLGFVAADDQPFPRARQRHIEQPAVFAHFARLRAAAFAVRHGLSLQILVHAEEDAILRITEARLCAA